MRITLQSFLHTAKRIMFFLLAAILLIILLLFMMLWIWSPGKPKPFTDAGGKTLANSISEKLYVDINGVKQGMFIKGKDVSKPLLLYIHGGMPDYFLNHYYPISLENDFVVAWWEQRGAGMSYHPNIAPGSITTTVLVDDVLAVTNYLKERFNQEKIYLMGHSGGTFIGIMAAAKAPALYHAYIGIAQASDQRRSEKLAYDYMLQQFKITGKLKMVNRLQAAPVTLTSTPKEYLAVRDEAMHSLGIGTMRDMRSVVSGLFFPSLRFPEYTVKEKINFWRAKANSGVSIAWKDMLSTDLSKEVPELQIPVYFIEGIYDYTCAYTLAKSYFNQLKAPVKGFYTFYESAHSPMFEEPAKLRHILKEDVLMGRTNLADRTENVMEVVKM